LTRKNTHSNLVNVIKIRKTAYLGHRYMRHQEYSQIQVIIEGKMAKKSRLRKMRDWTSTNKFDILIASLKQDGT